MYSLIRDDLVAETRQEPRSRSRETTFAKDTRDWSTIAGVLAELCKQVVEDPQEHGYAGRIIGAKLRYINFLFAKRADMIAGSQSTNPVCGAIAMNHDGKTASGRTKSGAKSVGARKASEKKMLTVADRLGDFIGCNTDSGIPSDASVNHKKYFLDALGKKHSR